MKTQSGGSFDRLAMSWLVNRSARSDALSALSQSESGVSQPPTDPAGGTQVATAKLYSKPSIVAADAGTYVLFAVDFTRTGNPNAPGLPQWPSYNAAGKEGAQWQVMHLDANSEAKPDTQRDRYLFLDEAWGKPKD